MRHALSMRYQNFNPLQGQFLQQLMALMRPDKLAKFFPDESLSEMEGALSNFPGSDHEQWGASKKQQYKEPQMISEGEAYV